MTSDGVSGGVRKDIAFLIKNFDDALIFHSPEWLKMLEKCYRLNPHHLTSATSDSTAMMPLFLVNSPLFGRKLTTQPFNFYGGILSSSEESTRSIMIDAKKLWAEHKTRYVEIKNVCPLNAEIVKEFNLIERSPVVRYVVPLYADAEEFDKHLKRRFREKIKRLGREAASRGLSIEEANPGDEYALRAFYNLLTDEYRKKHFMLVQPYRLFRLVSEKLRQRFHLYVARLDNKIIGGAIILRFNQVDYYLWGAYDQNCESLSPLTLILAEAMRFGRQAGSHSLDLGVTSRSHEGLNFFKSRWGGDCEPLNYYYMANSAEDVPHLDYFNSFRTARQMIRFVPRQIVQTISPLVINWLA